MRARKQQPEPGGPHCSGAFQNKMLVNNRYIYEASQVKRVHKSLVYTPLRTHDYPLEVPVKGIHRKETHALLNHSSPSSISIRRKDILEAESSTQKDLLAVLFTKAL